MMTTSVSLKGGFDGSTMLPIQVFRGLKRAGVEIRLAHMRARPPWGGVRRDEFEGVPYYTVPAQRWVGGLEAIRREFPFDVIHAEHYGGATRSYFAASRGNWPMVYQIHSLLGDEVERDRLGRDLKFKFHVAVERKVCGFAAAVTVLGREVKRVVTEEKGVPSDRVHVIYPGMDLTPYEGEPAASEIPGVGPDDQVVMYVGNLEHPNQGVSRLVDALPSVFRASPRARCVLVGGPREAGEAYRARLEAAGEGFGDRLTVLLGKTPDDIVGLTRRADVLVHARLACRENYSVQTKMAVYLAARRPIVATDFGDYRELLGETGAGLLTGEEPEAIADGVLKVLGNPDLGRWMAARTWNVAREHFCTSRNAERYLRVYEDALRKGPQSGSGSSSGGVRARERSLAGV